MVLNGPGKLSDVIEITRLLQIMCKSQGRRNDNSSTTYSSHNPQATHSGSIIRFSSPPIL